jgi:phosphotransferase system HPr (HPr) family protein
MHDSECSTEKFACRVPDLEGMHMRTSAVFARALREITSNDVRIVVTNKETGRKGNGKEMIDVMGLGLSGTVTFEVALEGQKTAVSAVLDTVRAYLAPYIACAQNAEADGKNV